MAARLIDTQGEAAVVASTLDLTERRELEQSPAKPQIIEAMRGAGTLYARARE